jgi:hypothetical protein
MNISLDSNVFVAGLVLRGARGGRMVNPASARKGQNVGSEQNEVLRHGLMDGAFVSAETENGINICRLIRQLGEV